MIEILLLVRSLLILGLVTGALAAILHSRIFGNPPRPPFLP